MQSRPFSLIGVNSDADINTAKKAIADENLTWRSFWNGPQGTRGPISNFYGVRGWPTIYVLDQDGVIRAKNVRGEALDKVVDYLVEEAESKERRELTIEGMGPKIREFTDSTGSYKVKAEFVDFENGKAVLLTEDGREIEMEMSKLSQEDQKYIREQLKKNKN